MPLPARSLRRLSELLESTRNPLTSKTQVDNNIPPYWKWLEEHHYDPKMSDVDFDAFDVWADDPAWLPHDVKREMFDKFAMPAPRTLYRGEGLYGPSENLSTFMPHLNDFASTSMDELMARDFAGGHSRDIDRAGIAPWAQRRAILAELRNHSPTLKALPNPISGESEFVLHPDTQKSVLHETPDEADDLLRRLYLLKKRGGPVHALP